MFSRSCDLMWSTLKQFSNLNDMKLEINVICKLEAEGLFEKKHLTDRKQNLAGLTCDPS